MEKIDFDEENAIKQRYLELDERNDHLREMIDELDGGYEKFLRDYYISWIFHENGLEGVVLGYPEIRSALDNKVISDDTLFATHQGVKAQQDCTDSILEKSENRRYALNISYLKDLHGRLVDNPEEAGVYRKDIPIHRTYFHAIAQPAKIHQELGEVLDYLKARRDRDLHPIEFAANVHHRFMRVFPFSRFSGIIGRLITNFVLVREDYVPLVIHASDRQHYYEALRNKEKDFRYFIAASLENSIDNAIKFVSQKREEQEESQRRMVAQ